MQTDRGRALIDASRELRVHAQAAMETSRLMLRRGRALLDRSAERCEKAPQDLRPEDARPDPVP